MAQERRYTKRRRAEAEQETRARIVGALMTLHEEVGPARTTVSAVAQRAGVERLTVYRHFPDETSMIQACSARWAELNPPPVPRLDSRDPLANCRRALRDLYGWYRSHQRMLANVARDSAAIPLLREMTQPFVDYLDELTTTLERAFPRRSSRRRATLRHALSFPAWQSLSAVTRSDREAADLVTRWIAAC